MPAHTTVPGKNRCAEPWTGNDLQESRKLTVIAHDQMSARHRKLKVVSRRAVATADAAGGQHSGGARRLDTMDAVFHDQTATGVGLHAVSCEQE